MNAAQSRRCTHCDRGCTCNIAQSQNEHGSLAGQPRESDNHGEKPKGTTHEESRDTLPGTADDIGNAAFLQNFIQEATSRSIRSGGRPANMAQERGREVGQVTFPIRDVEVAQYFAPQPRIGRSQPGISQVHNLPHPARVFSPAAATTPREPLYSVPPIFSAPSPSGGGSAGAESRSAEQRELELEHKAAIRREKNRVSAMKSNRRRQAVIDGLRREIQAAKREAERLEWREGWLREENLRLRRAVRRGPGGMQRRR